MPGVAYARQFALLLCGRIHTRADGIGHDEAIARLARIQFGVVSRAQLLTLGLSARAIEHRISCGRLRYLHRGVYAVGHQRIGFRGRVFAALLTMGPGAVASHRTAAALAGVRVPSNGPIHVTTRKSRKPQPGIVLHRGRLAEDSATAIGGIPVTTLAMTFLDLSCTERPATLRRLVKDAEFNDLVTFVSLASILERYPRRRGRGNLAALVRSAHADSGRTRSELQDLFTDFITARAIEPPERNVPMWIGGRNIEVDCLWREARLALELDSRSAHDRALAFEDDRVRDRSLVAARWRPMRVTWTQLHGSVDRVEADIRSALAT